jgi:hypothetical protein
MNQLNTAIEKEVEEVNTTTYHEEPMHTNGQKQLRAVGPGQ